MAGSAGTSAGGASSGGGVPYYYQVQKDERENIIGLPVIQYRKPTEAAKPFADDLLQPTNTANAPPKKATGPPRAAAPSVAPPRPEKPFEKETAVEKFDATPEVAKDGTTIQNVDEPGKPSSRSASPAPKSASSAAATEMVEKPAPPAGIASRVSYSDPVGMKRPADLLASDAKTTTTGETDRSDKSGVSVASEYGGGRAV